MNDRPALSPHQIALRLGVCALVCFVVLWLLHLATRTTIAETQARQRQALLSDVLGEITYDNEPEQDAITRAHPLLGSDDQRTLWRARRGGEPVGIVLSISAPYGYNGPIELLLGLTVNGEISGARVVSHRETPGLGDAIELARSDWILQFDQRSRLNPPAERWRVNKDGGDFDHITGATVTARTIVLALHHALEYFHQHQETLFDP